MIIITKSSENFFLLTGFAIDDDGFSKGFFKNDQIHRNKERGPAIYYIDGYSEYWENDKIIGTLCL